jgi:hypothetical protein
LKLLKASFPFLLQVEPTKPAGCNFRQALFFFIFTEQIQTRPPLLQVDYFVKGLFEKPLSGRKNIIRKEKQKNKKIEISYSFSVSFHTKYCFQTSFIRKTKNLIGF